MKKKKIIILIFVIIAILLVLGTIFVIYNKNKNKFILNKDRYIVTKSIVSSMHTDKAVSVKINYYEIDLKNSTVDLREDFIYADENGNYSTKSDKNYSRKLISTKDLTQEENQKLEKFFERIIKENKQTNTEKNYTISSSGSFLKYFYYTITTKNKENIIFDTEENIQEFEEIVKIVKIDGSEDFYMEFGKKDMVNPAVMGGGSNPNYWYYLIKRNGAVYLNDSLKGDSYIKTLDENTLKDIEKYISEKVSENYKKLPELKLGIKKDEEWHIANCSSEDINYLMQLINK